MQGQHSPQSSFFGMIYDELVPPDHLLRRIAASVDFAFVSELVGDWYCPDNGRPSWDPLVLFRVVLVLFDKLRVVSNVESQFLYDLSDREVEEEVTLNLASKWFVGLQPEDQAPDYTVLWRAEARGRGEKPRRGRTT